MSVKKIFQTSRVRLNGEPTPIAAADVLYIIAEASAKLGNDKPNEVEEFQGEWEDIIGKLEKLAEPKEFTKYKKIIEYNLELLPNLQRKSTLQEHVDEFVGYLLN